ncbi:MAG: nucleotidyltransferase substrate binding protein [Chitinivibrionales bacterium]|nr:nucleotidyltransferase substrate binding protein [Chitinivibrionales bacterium]
MSLVLVSLKEAVSALEKSINSYSLLSHNTTLTIDDMNTIKAGVIQNFEVAYEQCWKFMKRWIEENVSSTIVDGVTRRELFRISAEQHIIDDVEEWMNFHRARNLSSHTYDRTYAENTFAAAQSFLPSAKELICYLEAHND